MTNRDKFNKMSNAELATILIWTGANDRCKFCCYTRERCFGKSCFDSIKKWLNSPCANEPENPPADKHVDLQRVSEKISRAGRKNPDNTIEDLRKAVWYINRQIQRLEREGK